MATFQQLPGYNFRPPSFNPLPVGSYFNREVPKLEVADINRAIAPIAEGVSQAVLNRPRFQAQQQANADAKRSAELQETLRQRMDDPAHQQSIAAGPGGLTYDPSRPLQFQLRQDAINARRESAEANRQYREQQLALQRERLLASQNRRSSSRGSSVWDRLSGSIDESMDPAPPIYPDESISSRYPGESLSVPPRVEGLFDASDLPMDPTGGDAPNPLMSVGFEDVSLEVPASMSAPIEESVSFADFSTLDPWGRDVPPADFGMNVPDLMGSLPDLATQEEASDVGLSMAIDASGALGGGGFDSLIQEGNIDLANRPIIRNADGTISTVGSIIIGTDQGQVVIPTVARDGSGILTPEQAEQQFRDTGEHLGVFADIPSAEAFATQLSAEQDQMYSEAPAPMAGQPPSATASPTEPPAPFTIPTLEEKTIAAVERARQTRPEYVAASGAQVFRDNLGQEYIRAGFETNQEGVPVELRAYRTTSADARGNPQFTRVPLLQKQRVPASLQKEMMEKGVAWDDYTTPQEAIQAISEAQSSGAGEDAPSLNATQQKKAQAALSAIAAIRDVEDLSQRFDRSSLRAAAASALSEKELLRPAAAWIGGKEALEYEDSMMRWIEQVLRDMSGAAIKDNEYGAYKRMYFPTAGDSEGAIDRKRKARETAVRGIMMGMSLSTVNSMARELGSGRVDDPDALFNQFAPYAVREESIPQGDASWDVMAPYKVQDATTRANEIMADPSLSQAQKVAAIKALRNQGNTAQQPAPAPTPNPRPTPSPTPVR